MEAIASRETTRIIGCMGLIRTAQGVRARVTGREHDVPAEWASSVVVLPPLPDCKDRRVGIIPKSLFFRFSIVANDEPFSESPRE